MTTPLILTLPARDRALCEEIEQQLAPYADVQVQPPATFNLDEIKLVIDTVGGAVGIAANVASVLTFLLMLKDRTKQTGHVTGIRVGGPGERGVALEDADEALLRRLLNGE
jgi:hypothetical protein